MSQNLAEAAFNFLQKISRTKTIWM